jgi:hypothetical protein
MSQPGSETAAPHLIAEVDRLTAIASTPDALALPLRTPASRERESADRLPA